MGNYICGLADILLRCRRGKQAVASSRKLDGSFISDDTQSETQSIEHKYSTTEPYVQSQYCFETDRSLRVCEQTGAFIVYIALNGKQTEYVLL